MLILSIIPIRFLYWIQPLFTVILPGILFGIVFKYSLAKGFVILIFSLPHMLFEVFAFCVWMVALDQFNKWIRYKISKKKSADINLLKELKLLLSPYIKYVLPLIVITAFTETYVADWISHILSSRRSTNMVQQIVLPIKDSNILQMVQDTLLDSFRAGRSAPMYPTKFCDKKHKPMREFHSLKLP